MNQIRITLLSLLILSYGAQAMHLQYYATIHAAAKAGDVQAVQAFLDAEIPVDQVDKYGYTALMMAANNGHEQTINLLIANGASINRANFHDETSLMWAADNGRAPVMRLLITNGASINHANFLAETALIQAAKNGHEQAVHILIAHGASVNHTNNKLETALMLAASNAHIPCCKLLINRLLKIPCDAHRPKLYTFFMCMKRYRLDHNMRRYIKPYLLTAVEEENRESPEGSVALQEIEKIKSADVRNKLIANHWPHYKPSQRWCVLQ